jgi:hypothetical protein
MSQSPRFSKYPVRAALAAALLSVLGSVSACDEDGKTAPDKCRISEPPFDIQAAGGVPEDNDCLTDIGHAVNSVGTAPSGGTAAGGTAAGGKGGTATGSAGAP